MFWWVQMGADGCDRVQGCGRTGKQGKHAYILIYSTWFSALWPGNFPKKSYACGVGIKVGGWV